MLAASRGSPKAAEGLWAATALKRAQSAAISLRWRSAGRPSAAARAFSMSAYCCTGGSTMPAATSTGATKSGGLVSTSSGGPSSSSISTPPSRAHARASAPATTTVPNRPAATAASA